MTGARADKEVRGQGSGANPPRTGRRDKETGMVGLRPGRSLGFRLVGKSENLPLATLFHSLCAAGMATKCLAETCAATDKLAMLTRAVPVLGAERAGLGTCLNTPLYLCSWAM